MSLIDSFLMKIHLDDEMSDDFTGCGLKLFVFKFHLDGKVWNFITSVNHHASSPICLDLSYQKIPYMQMNDVYD